MDVKTIQTLMRVILQQADDALYQAKRMGRDRCEIATGRDPSIDVSSDRYLPDFIKKFWPFN